MDQLVPFILGVFERVAFSRRAAVVVQPKAIDLVELPGSLFDYFREKAPRPAHVSAVRSARDVGELCRLISRSPGGEPSEVLSILLRQHVAAAAPRLVADSPIGDIVW